MSEKKHSKCLVENTINFWKEWKEKKDGIGVSTRDTRSMGGGTEINLQPWQVAKFYR